MQGEKLAEFDTRSILETADARAGAVIPSRQPATTPDGQSSLRKRAGSKRRRSSSPGATADGMGEPLRAYHSSASQAFSTLYRPQVTLPPWVSPLLDDGVTDTLPAGLRDGFSRMVLCYGE